MDFAMLFLKSAKVSFYFYQPKPKKQRIPAKNFVIIDKLREKLFNHHSIHPHFFNIYSLIPQLISI